MPTGDRPIHIFQGGKDGYGFADNPNDGRDVYHYTFNWNCQSEGRSVPATAPEHHQGALIYSAPGALLEWIDTTTLDPYIYFAHGNGSSKRILTKFQDNGQTSASVAEEAFTGGAIYRYSGSGSNVDTPRAYFCNGEDNDVLVEAAATDPTTEIISGHDIKADGIYVVGSDLWLTQGYKIMKLTKDADPALDASYPTKIPVGIPTYAINKVVGLGGSPIGLKPEGAFKYNPAPNVKEYQNFAKYVTPHPDNGKAAFSDGRGRIYYDTADGHILVFTFAFTSQQQPSRTTKINRDTPFGRISAMTADTDFVYAGIDPGQVRTQDGVGLLIYDTTDDSTFNNRTTALTDRKVTTEADWTGITSADSNDAIFIGTDEPILGAYIELSPDSVRTADAANPLSVAISTGASSFTSVGSLDSTMVFARTGLIVPYDSSTAFADLLNRSTNPWVAHTKGGDLPSKYWMRIKPGASTTGLAKVKAVHIVPYRPPIDPDNQPVSAYARAGCLPKILVGQWRGEEIMWHDMWTLETPAVTNMIVTQAHHITSVGDRALTVLHHQSLSHMSTGADAHPLRQPWPKLADWGESGTVSDHHQLYFSGNNFGLPQYLKTVTGRMILQVPWLQEDDELFVYTWWDDDTEYIQKHGAYAGESPIVVDNIEGEGYILYSAVIYTDATRDANAMELHYVGIPEGEWEWNDNIAARARSKIASPQVA